MTIVTAGFADHHVAFHRHRFYPLSLSRVPIWPRPGTEEPGILEVTELIQSELRALTKIGAQQFRDRHKK